MKRAMVTWVTVTPSEINRHRHIDLHSPSQVLQKGRHFVNVGSYKFYYTMFFLAFLHILMVWFI